MWLKLAPAVSMAALRRLSPHRTMSSPRRLTHLSCFSSERHGTEVKHGRKRQRAGLDGCRTPTHACKEPVESETRDLPGTGRSLVSKLHFIVKISQGEEPRPGPSHSRAWEHWSPGGLTIAAKPRWWPAAEDQRYQDCPILRISWKHGAFLTPGVKERYYIPQYRRWMDGLERVGARPRCTTRGWTSCFIRKAQVENHHMANKGRLF